MPSTGNSADRSACFCRCLPARLWEQGRGSASWGEGVAEGEGGAASGRGMRRVASKAQGVRSVRDCHTCLSRCHRNSMRRWRARAWPRRPPVRGLAWRATSAARGAEGGQEAKGRVMCARPAASRDAVGRIRGRPRADSAGPGHRERARPYRARSLRVAARSRDAILHTPNRADIINPQNALEKFLHTRTGRKWLDLFGSMPLSTPDLGAGSRILSVD